MRTLLLASQALDAGRSVDGGAANLTREIFGNIPHWSQVAFYLAAAAASLVFVWGVARRVRSWCRGKPESPAVKFLPALRRVLRDVILQRRIWGRGLASLAHALLFGGFAVLFMGTTLIAIEHVLAATLGRVPTNPVFHKGAYFAVFEIVMDAAGIAFLVGCAIFLNRRWSSSESFARAPADVLILLLFITIGITGFIVEGLRIIHEQTSWPGFSPIGLFCAQAFQHAGMTRSVAIQWHFVLWWVHAGLALGIIALVPYSRLLHAIAGTLSLAARGEESTGVMQPVDLQIVEETGKIGVGSISDFARRVLVQLDACVSCGRCEDACPAFEAGKPLSPRNVVQELAGCNRSNLSSANTSESVLPGHKIAEATLWSCTTCGACTEVCPLGVSPLRMITDMRRFLIGEGQLRGAPATALQKTGRVRNPWGLSPGDRLQWAKGLDVRTPSLGERQEFLYWVGCAAAYDRRIQKVAQSFVKVLNAAGVEFAVLGPEEGCTGESARRMGDELLFHELATQNIDTLNRYNVKRIVAHCPHCVNSFRHDYPQLGADYEVLHHSELLAQLQTEGRLPTTGGHRDSNENRIAYHDPCYLARANHIVDEPRRVLAATASPLVELPRNRSHTACCGGGGGRMWFDDKIDERVGHSRVQEINGSGAQTVAVSCPFCLTMLSDGLAAASSDVQVRDIAELLAEAIDGTNRADIDSQPE